VTFSTGRWRGRLRLALLSSFLDHGLGSAVGLTLTLAAGRRLGASGLGAVTVGLALYLVLSSVHRGVVVEPLVVHAPHERGAGTREALSASLLMGGAGTAVMYVLAGLTAGAPSEAFAAFAPWMAAGLVVEVGRAAGFRDGRTTVGTAAHALWLTVLVTLLVVLRGRFDVGAAALAWGTGGAAGAALVLLRLRALPAGLRVTWTWWAATWRLGRWLALQTSAVAGAIQAGYLLVALFAGPAALGTLKAVQTLFAPLTFLLPAVSSPALPVVTRTMRASAAVARSLTARLTLLLCAVCAAYLSVAVVLRGPLTELAFGPSFVAPPTIVWPVAVEQLIVAAAVGAMLTLKAAGRGREIFVATAAGVAVILAGTAVAAPAWGAAGAAWANAAGALVACVVTCGSARAGHKDAPGGAGRVKLAAV
jgi:O-antigen/teichoic acid export membrane protein